jgi:hypothetical protein
MKKVLIMFIILIFSNNMLIADELDSSIRDNCYLLVHKTMLNINETSVEYYMFGLATGITYLIPEDKKSDLLLETDYSIVIKIACKKLLQKKTESNFKDKFIKEIYRLSTKIN